MKFLGRITALILSLTLIVGITVSALGAEGDYDKTLINESGVTVSVSSSSRTRENRYVYRIACTGENHITSLTIGDYCDVEFDGTGIVYIDSLVYETTSGLYFYDDIAPAVFVKESGNKYNLINTTDAPGLIDISVTVPGDYELYVPAGTRLILGARVTDAESDTYRVGQIILDTDTAPGAVMTADGEIIVESIKNSSFIAGNIKVKGATPDTLIFENGQWVTVPGNSNCATFTLSQSGKMTINGIFNGAGNVTLNGIVTGNDDGFLSCYGNGSTVLNISGDIHAYLTGDFDTLNLSGGNIFTVSNTQTTTVNIDTINLSGTSNLYITGDDVCTDSITGSGTLNVNSGIIKAENVARSVRISVNGGIFVSQSNGSIYTKNYGVYADRDTRTHSLDIGIENTEKFMSDNQINDLGRYIDDTYGQIPVSWEIVRLSKNLFDGYNATVSVEVKGTDAKSIPYNEEYYLYTDADNTDGYMTTRLSLADFTESDVYTYFSDDSISATGGVSLGANDSPFTNLYITGINKQGNVDIRYINRYGNTDLSQVFDKIICAYWLYSFTSFDHGTGNTITSVQASVSGNAIIGGTGTKVNVLNPVNPPATDTPDSTPSPTPEESRTPTPTPAPTPSAQPESTQSPTPAPTPSAQPESTQSPTPTRAPVETLTPTRTKSPSRTPIPSSHTTENFSSETTSAENSVTDSEENTVSVSSQQTSSQSESGASFPIVPVIAGIGILALIIFIVAKTRKDEE